MITHTFTYNVSEQQHNHIVQLGCGKVISYSYLAVVCFSLHLDQLQH